MGLFAAAVPNHAQPEDRASAAARAEANGRLAQEALLRCHRYLRAWLGVADPRTGLIPRNLNVQTWNGKDAAADNYPFMVMSAWLTDRPAFEGAMKRMLASERTVTARPDWLRLTDDYELGPRPGLRFPAAEGSRILFNSAEYVKDGLLALTEWLGASPWSERMFELIEDSFAIAAVETPYGRIPLAGMNSETGVEVSGDHLQALARLYWMRGDPRYLEWGSRLARFYLLPEARHHPTRDFRVLRLRDHGCEIVSGLCEFYATLHYAGRREGGQSWARLQSTLRPHLHEMLDRILAVGRNEDGLLHNEIEPQSGRIVDARLSDSWGYVLNGYYTVFLVDGVEAYREAALKPLGALDRRYRGFAWEPSGNSPHRLGSQDGYADSIEGALNLANRLPASDARAQAAFSWIDSEIRELWSRQQPDGFIERWHGDGNFARTSIMYALWKTQGVTIQPWREDVRLGAVREGGTLHLSIAADRAWAGVLVFDRARHSEYLRLPVDWPRINQFPEWFTVQREARYEVRQAGQRSPGESIAGAGLLAGLRVNVPANGSVGLTIGTTP